MASRIEPSGGTDEKSARHTLFTYLRAGAGIEAAQGIEKRRDSKPAPLSFAQERLWFLDQLLPGNAAYHICKAQRLHGPLDVEVLTRALNHVVRRHEALRTSFRSHRDQPVQIVLDSLSLTMNVLDASAAELAHLIFQEAQRPFELGAGPLLRMTLIRLAAAEHVLVLTVHQMVFDGWSVGLLFKELASIYEAEIGGRPPALPVLPVQYADYALWQREQVQGEALQSQLDFWTSRFDRTLPILSLPSTRARPLMQSHRGARRPLSIDQATWRGLLDISRRAGSTLFEVLMAAYNVLLHRYSSQSDIIVGFPIANREQSEVENVIGFFVNTLALRTDLSGDPGFSELLLRVRDGLREVYKNRELPFEKLVEALRVERDLSRNPIFQSMFVYQNEATPLLQLPGIIATPIDSDTGGAKFDLTLSVMRGQDGLTGFFEYDTGLFDAAWIDSMAGHWKALLAGIVADPHQRLSRLPILTEDERQQLLVQWNSTKLDLPEELCIHETFEAQVERTPEAVAVEFDGACLTYRELNRRANRLARHLRALGVRPEALVGICIERGFDMIVSLLAVLKAGGAYLPIDPSYPRERIAFMLRDARILALITRKVLIEDRGWRIEDGNGGSTAFNPQLKLICLDRDAAVVERRKATNPKFKVDSRNLAYVIYTSGSTGQPKGVAIEHRNAVALLSWAKTAYTAADLAAVLASTSICFDLSVFEIFLPLCAGGSVILVENALRLNSCGARNRITLVNTVPSVMRELWVEGGFPPAVRIVNLAGEPLSTDLVEQIYRAGTVAKVYDLYGPSETTTYSSFTLRTANSPATIGRPIANAKIYILDANLEPVPVGVQGEIVIGGSGVARGYLNRPALTGENFFPDPLSGDKDARVYRSGDLARYLADGNIEYLGRADQQVKIRGYRIEPGEIEAALNAHPAIAQSIVVARPREIVEHPPSENPKSEIQNPKSDRRLVAYLVPNEYALPSVGELRSFLRERLPEFMLPEDFIPVDRWPLSANGKIDRSALPAPDRERARLAGEFIAPRSEVEELIAETWREALKIERISANDNFFELGGHSLLATRVVARLRASFAVELELRKLFELPTVRALARHIEWLRGHRTDITFAAIATGAARDQAPLSFAQRRLWFLHQLDPGLTAYNITAAYRIKGPLDIPVLESAVKQMVERHESLRTAVVEIDGQGMQRMVPPANVTIPMVDLGWCSGAAIDAAIDRRLNQEARGPFDLRSAPLMRLGLLRFAADDHALLINFHHIIADASSLAIFYGELAALYEAALDQRVVKLPALAVRYADFAAWQQDWVQQPGFRTQLAYWKRQLGGRLAPLDLPRDFERSGRPSFHGARLTCRLSAELTKAIKLLSRRQGATLFMTLLATLKLLFARLSGKEDVVIGTTIAGRNRAELDNVIGFFVNALALRTDLSGNPTFVELLQRVREVCLDAYAHQEMPFERIVEEIKPRRDPGRNPIFQVLFNMNDVGERDLRLSGCEIRKISQSLPEAKFDLVVQAPQIDGCIELTMVYDAELFSAARIAVMLQQWSCLLQQIAAGPARPIGSYSLLTPESKKLLPDPTATLDDAWHGSIHGSVSRQGERHADAPAVVDDRQRWSYEELDRASSRLANYLIANGIGPRDTVAIYAHRDASLAVALLGVLKAGAVFLIFDPAYPPARLAAYWRIARPKALLPMERAGPLPDELESCAHDTEMGDRIVVPSTKQKFARRFGEFSDQAPVLEVRAEDPAYVAFTSGSTGQPKGVLCRHGPITHFLRWQEAAFGLKSSDRYSLLSGLAYNHLQRDLFTALASGAAVHVPSADCLKEPSRLVDWLRHQEITVVHLTPALGRLLCGRGRTIIPALRRIFFGGDVLTPADVRAMHELAPNAEMVGFYGATETQRAVGFLRIPAAMLAGGNGPRRAIPVGRGIPDVQLLVLTSNGQLAGVGEIGELYVRSPHLASGYIDDPALTGASFVTNPFTRRANDRLYRTGEFGRYAPDGDVEWAGRRERRANIRGFRIDLTEIEATLKRFAAVKDCAVALKDFETGGGIESKDERLVAYIEANPDTQIGLDDLRRFAREALPHYMVPAYFQWMDRLPIGANGKIDYDSLPPPDISMKPSAGPFEAPRGSVEQTLTEVLADLLGVEQLGRHDHFFDCGGHSLLAAQAVARIRARLGVQLEVRAFFESPTVEALARRIDAARTGTASTKVKDDEREEIEL